MSATVKVTTAGFRQRLRPVGNRAMCWEAVLASFGITVPHDEMARSPEWVLGQLAKGGWQCKHVPFAYLTGAHGPPTLAVLVSEVADGDWLLFLDKHVISIRDGVITDTAGQKRTVKRHVRLSYRLVPPGGLVVNHRCSCSDPLVFCHGYHTGLGGHSHNPS